VRLAYGPLSYYRLGAAWPRLKLREPWPARVRYRAIGYGTTPPTAPQVHADASIAVALLTTAQTTVSDTTQADLSVAETTTTTLTVDP